MATFVLNPKIRSGLEKNFFLTLKMTYKKHLILLPILVKIQLYKIGKHQKAGLSSHHTYAPRDPLAKEALRGKMKIT